MQARYLSPHPRFETPAAEMLHIIGERYNDMEKLKRESREQQNRRIDELRRAARKK